MKRRKVKIPNMFPCPNCGAPMLRGWKVCPDCGESVHRQEQPIDRRGLARVHHVEQVETYYPPLGEYLRTVSLVILAVVIVCTLILVFG